MHHVVVVPYACSEICTQHTIQFKTAICENNNVRTDGTIFSTAQSSPNLFILNDQFDFSYYLQCITAIYNQTRAGVLKNTGVIFSSLSNMVITKNLT